jgi:hypothetical protein
MPFSIPTHAIVMDRGNGVLSRESYAVVVDLDARETTSYHFRHEQDGKLTLVDKTVKSVGPEPLQAMIAKANVVWNPPIPKEMPRPTPDLFETTYVVSGPLMASEMSGGNDPKWLLDLKNAVEASGKRP